MEKSKFTGIITLFIFLFILLCILFCFIIIKNKKYENIILELNNEVNELKKTNAIDLKSNVVANNVTNNSNFISNNETVQEPSGKAFSNSDLKFTGIGIGSSSEEAVSQYGSDFISSVVERPSLGKQYTLMNYFDLGIEFYIETVMEDGVIAEIFMFNDCNVETSRGIKIGSLVDEIKNVYPSSSILEESDSLIVVGFSGDTGEQSSKGRIYFNIINSKVVSYYVAKNKIM